MKFLLDKLAVGGRQWRVFADTSVKTAWVIDGESVYEFASRHDAYQHVVAEYRRVADMRNMQPGQSYSITMADGTSKQVQVQNQTPEGVQVMDPNSGQVMMIPHVQPGAEPKPASPNNGPSMTPKPNATPQNQPATPVSPENRTYSLGLNDLKVRASEYGRTPQNCKHDGTHLNKKNPSDPEKFCPDCGMVYAASKVAYTPGPPTVGKFYFCKRCNTSRTALLDRDGQEVHRALADGRVVRYLSCKHPSPIDDTDVKPSWQPRGASKGADAETERINENKKKHTGPHKFKAAEWTHPNGHPRCIHCGDEEPIGGRCKTGATFSPFDEPPVFPEGKPKVEYRPYRCMNCGHEQMLQTNHLGKVTAYCENCSWKPSFGNPDYAVPGQSGRTYRPFEYAGPTDRTVLQKRNAGCDSDYWMEGDDCDCPHHKGKKTAVITGGPGSYHVKSEEGKNLGGPYKTREQAEHRLKQVEYFKHKGAVSPLEVSNPDPMINRLFGTWTCPQCRTQGIPKRQKACQTCGSPQPTATRAFKKTEKIISDSGECVNCGASGKSLNDKGECAKCQRRKVFRAWKNRERIVRAFDLIKQADAPFAGQQGMPSAETSNMGETLKMDEKSPGEFAEEPEFQPRTQDPNAKRKLTPHEIIEEAESLIRNALVKGVVIGASELSDYMTQYYQNPPDELMKGIALAWQKVQYEENMEGAGGPNAPGGEGFGPQAPTTPEDAAQMAPRNGPIRTRKIL